jgi:hypothetical protein
MKRFAIWLAVSLIVLPLVCVVATDAGAPEEYAEMAHGTLGTLITLWALRWLRPWREIVGGASLPPRVSD